jgi:predicted membrane channel-forming protein YqfA (hemolysin III family)
MRPASIVLFERLVLLGIVLGIINTVLVWDELNAQVAQTGMGSGAVIGIQVVTTLLYLLLIWFISRHGSPVAKWIYVVLAGIGLVVGLAGIGQTMELGMTSAILSIVSYVITAVAIWLLFRPDSKAWFSDGRGGGNADPEVFR